METGCAADTYIIEAGGYGWQIRMPDPAALIRMILPVLNQRLSASEFARYTGKLEINLYRHAVAIGFVDGEIVDVEASESVGWGDLRIPPNLLAPLVLGQRSWGECSRRSTRFSTARTSTVLAYRKADLY